jgi:hypothetical protein
VHEWKLDAGGALMCARVVELALGTIEPDASRAAFRKRDRLLCGTAAELQDVLTGDIAENAELVFGNRPDAPRHWMGGELLAVLGLILIALPVPVIAVSCSMSAEVHIVPFGGHSGASSTSELQSESWDGFRACFGAGAAR